MISIPKIWEILVTKFGVFMQGVGTTVELALFTVVFGSILGLIVAVFRQTRIMPLRWLMNAYVAFIRGTPLLVQVLMIVYGLPQLGLRLPRMTLCVIALVINSGAYMAELIRSGLNAVPNGQMEAGRSLGMTWAQTMRYIIVPQAARRVIPPLGNEFIALLKDSSLVSVIGFEELTRRGQLIIARTYASLEIWLCVAIIYLVMTVSISRLVAWLERRYKIDDQR